MSDGIVIVNFAHPLTEQQRAQIEAMAGQPVARVVDVEAQVDLGQKIGPQVAALVDGVALSATEWQTAQNGPLSHPAAGAARGQKRAAAL